MNEETVSSSSWQTSSLTQCSTDYKMINTVFLKEFVAKVDIAVPTKVHYMHDAMGRQNCVGGTVAT